MTEAGGKLRVDLIVGPADELVTMAGPGRLLERPAERPAERRVTGSPPGSPSLEPPAYLGLIPGGVAACAHGRIAAVGTEAEVLAAVEPAPECVRVEARGKVVTPGFVDCHTHLVFAGWRAEEFELRLAGAGYMEILRRGGGILSTVRATRAASEEELYESGRRRLDDLLARGTTTVEVKSGYGLDLETEAKCLRVVRRLGRDHPVEVAATFLGAHAVPPEFEGRADAYVDFVAGEVIPRIAAEGLAEFVDVFCEEGVFAAGQCRRVLEAGLAHGLRPKLHADEFRPSGGAELAAEVGAVSADHLACATRAGLKAMADRGAVAVVLPGTSLFLRLPGAADARAMFDLGLEVALATDFNPGSSPFLGLPLAMSLGCLLAGLSPAEALWAATAGGARALGRAERIGTLAPGKAADLVVHDAPSWRHLAYRLGETRVRAVVKSGRVVAGAVAAPDDLAWCL